MEDQFHSSIEIELRDPIAPGLSSLSVDSYSGVHTEVRGAADESWKFPSQELEKYLVDKDDVKFTNRKQRAFYKHQNQLIEEILETERNANKINTEEEDDEDAKLSAFQLRAKKIAIYSSAAVNILLFVIKTYAAITSGSLTVIASALDSFLDLLSGSIIFLTEFISSRVSSERYPVGKSRFEPVGLVIFSSCMFMATIQLLLTSVKSLITKDSSLDVSTTTFVIIGTTIVLKSILFIYCRTVKSSSAHALAMDHRNDIITNTFGILSVFLSRYYWEVDSVGAIIISFYVMFIWARTCYEQLVPLTGGSASKDFLNAITFVARQHHPDVIAIDTVRAYHIGYNYVVELDIVMDPQTPLHHAHDVGEALQIKLERLANVDRAFVHLDYEVEHKPEHKKTT